MHVWSKCRGVVISSQACNWRVPDSIALTRIAAEPLKEAPEEVDSEILADTLRLLPAHHERVISNAYFLHEVAEHVPCEYLQI